MNGIDRAAIFLLTLGEASAANVMRHLGPKEVQKIGTAMTKLGTVSVDQIDEVFNTFRGSVGSQTSIGLGADDFLRKTLLAAVGEEKANSLLDRIISGGSAKGLESMKWMDPRTIFETIRFEHPQIISILLAFLDPDQSAAVLQMFPGRDRVDMVLRMATLDSIQPNAIQELNDIMEKHFSEYASMQKSNVGGVKATANVLNFVDSSIEGEIIDSIKDIDPDLAQQIQDLMFVFENLVELDDRGMQTMLREVQSDSLILALKGADEALKEKIFRNMSKRAAEMLRDDLEARGPVRLSEVEAAQKEIVATARRLADAGEIMLGGSGGEQFI